MKPKEDAGELSGDISRPRVNFRNMRVLAGRVAAAALLVILIGSVLSTLIGIGFAVYAPDSDLGKGTIAGWSTLWSTVLKPPTELLQFMLVNWYPVVLFFFGIAFLGKNTR